MSLEIQNSMQVELEKVLTYYFIHVTKAMRERGMGGIECSFIYTRFAVYSHGTKA